MNSALLCRGLALCAVLAGGVSIATTWPILTHTIDEPIHISCGLEWLQAHRYTYERQHPPLGRIAAAMGPWIRNSTNVSPADLFPKSPLILYDSPSYADTLTSARAGEIVFYFWMCWEVWAWSSSLFSMRAAALAVTMLATTPVVLGHAGLATTDISLTCLLIAAAHRYWKWIESEYNLRNTLALSVLLALGACAKFTFLAFFPICALVITFTSRAARRSLSPIRSAAVILLSLTLMWGMYFFRMDSIPTSEGPVGLIRYLPDSLQSWLQKSPTVSLPLGGYYRGVVDAQIHDFNGHQSFLFGELKHTGWWYFFPAVFFLKTPVPFLLGIAISILMIRATPPPARAPLICGLALIVCVLPARISIGIRHILPVYPFFAIAVGVALDRLISSFRLGRAVAAFVIAAQFGVLLHTWPDNLAYFNFFAGRAPEEIRVDSDLDWGQDIARFAVWVSARGLKEPVGFAYFGSTNPTNHGLNWYRLSPWEPSSGWLAVSATELKMSDAERPQGMFKRPWWWLKGETPNERLGGILIYHIHKQR